MGTFSLFPALGPEEARTEEDNSAPSSWRKSCCPCLPSPTSSTECPASPPFHLTPALLHFLLHAPHSVLWSPEPCPDLQLPSAPARTPPQTPVPGPSPPTTHPPNPLPLLDSHHSCPGVSCSSTSRPSRSPNPSFPLHISFLFPVFPSISHPLSLSLPL